jgi:hypothetical protein
METEASTALVATRREERIERLTPHAVTHAATVVGKNNFDIVLPGRPHLDVDDTLLAVGKRVRDRVEEEVGQHLSVRSWITVHR